MRESTFIFRNKTRWESVESGEEKSSDELADDFVELVSDLSYAKTNYPSSQLTAYLNSLSSRLYKRIFLGFKQDSNPLAIFWKKDFPLLLGHRKYVLWFATGLFLTFCVLGYICSIVEENFVIGILGNEYVNMTSQNISEGKPFGVYESESPLLMFMKILTNNLIVGLLVFASGILLGLGSVYYTFTNGIMIGAFFSLFILQGLGLDAIFVIMLHGTFELMGLILECTAGLILGLSFLFPKTLSRKRAFMTGLSESARIYIGAVPFTFMAAVIESFVTYLGRGGIQGSSPALLIPLGFVFIASWVVVIWYFYIYPNKVKKQYPYHSYLQQFYD
jgi:uncharacterized membrane protein SpoIIM required for sporulation